MTRDHAGGGLLVVSLVAAGSEAEQTALVVAVGLVGTANTVAAAWLQRHLERRRV